MPGPDEDRRRLLLAGGLGALAAACPRLVATALAEDAAPRAKLVDAAGAPLKAASLVPDENYVFLYPHVSTPCLLLRLGHPQAPDAAPAGWPGGVGPDGAVVAYLAVCAHAFSYDSRRTSFVTYAAEGEGADRRQIIGCCAHGSRYDAASGARVVAGPATSPLAAIRLDYAADSDELTATGLVGPPLVDAFFKAYRADLNAEYGRGAYRAPVASTTTVMRLAEYSANVIAC
jgi:Rieske Fe-S protein